jgi:hypothetical protein
MTRFCAKILAAQTHTAKITAKLFDIADAKKHEPELVLNSTRQLELHAVVVILLHGCRKIKFSEGNFF